MKRQAELQRKTKTEDLFDLFVRLVETPAGLCWEWQGKVDPRFGYGACERLWNDRRYVLVHRLAYAVLKGEIPDGYTIDHRCKNRRCCNPKHLEAVPLSVNLERRQFKSKCPRGHSFDRVGFKKGAGLIPECSKCKSRKRGKGV